MSTSSRSAASASNTSSASRRPSTLVYFYRNDLRVHDNPCFHYAHRVPTTQASSSRPSHQHTHVVHLYCFDPDHFATTWHYKFPKTNVHRTRFLLDTVQNLSEKLKAQGSELIVSCERPKDALERVIALCSEGSSRSPVKSLVYQKEVTHEELLVEASVQEVADKAGTHMP